VKPSRRKFLGTLVAAGCVPAVGERTWTLVSAAMAETTATPEQSEEFDRNALDFWQHKHLTRRKVRGQSEDPTALAMGGARAPEFLLFTPEEGFRVASEIPDKELYSLGDVRIGLQVEAFKPSGGAAAARVRQRCTCTHGRLYSRSSRPSEAVWGRDEELRTEAWRRRAQGHQAPRGL